MGWTRWTEEELNYIQDNYPEDGPHKCAGALEDRTLNAVKNKARALGVRSHARLPGPKPKKIIRVIDDNHVIATCNKCGKSEHRVYHGKKDYLRCNPCYYSWRKTFKRTDVHRAKRATRSREWRETPRGRYLTRIRWSIWGALNGNMKGSTFSMLPYSKDELVKHFEKIRDGQGNSCPMCGDSYEEAGEHIDHIIPLSSAGNEAEILDLYELDNLTLLCPDCNMYVKRDKMPGTFAGGKV